MENAPESHPLIIINGWTIDVGVEFATVTIQPPSGVTGIIDLAWVSGQPAMKITWHTSTGSGTVNASRPSAQFSVEQGTVATVTGFSNNALWGPANSPQANGTHKADATFGPEGARMTISITVPSIGDGNLN